MQNNRLFAIIRCRCPICLKGPVFRSLLGMNSNCPNCGIHYERESGYFLVAMFIAYVIGFVILATLASGLSRWNAARIAGSRSSPYSARRLSRR